MGDLTFSTWSQCKSFCEGAATAAEASEGGCCFWQQVQKKCYLFLGDGFGWSGVSIFWPDDYASTCTAEATGDGGATDFLVGGARKAALRGLLALLSLIPAAVWAA